jgi:hypothetical protein
MGGIHGQPTWNGDLGERNRYHDRFASQRDRHRGNPHAGVHAADVVGDIRVDQAWGLFQISAARRMSLNASYDFLNAVGPETGDRIRVQRS